MLNKGIVSEEKPKPVLDEQTLAKLLEAAYVLQEHNREVREMELGFDLKRDQAESKQKTAAPAIHAEPAKKKTTAAPHGDYTFTLAQIVATQHQIQIRNLELDKAMALVTDRLIEMAGADGASIGMANGRKVRYRAVAGTMALPLGTEVPTDKALCLPCIKNAQVFRCADVNPEFLIDTEECRRRGIQSMIAVPIFHEGEVAGGLELYYSRQNGFSDQDVHTCQLMAGLVTEALARDEEVTWKQSLANERAMMLEALEQLKPKLDAIVEPVPAKQMAQAKVAAQPTSGTYFCGNCGHEMAADEHFCGQCGTARVTVSRSTTAPASAPSDVRIAEVAPAASHASTFPEQIPLTAAHTDSNESFAESLEREFPDLFRETEPVVGQADISKTATDAAAPAEIPTELSLHLPQELETEFKAEVPAQITNDHETPDTVEEKLDTNADGAITVPPTADWTSAAAAREFLEQVAAAKKRSGLARFWDTRRGDIYLAIAVILVACVIRWGIWSNRPVTATAAPESPGATAQHKAPDADLSMFDRMLISLGLAEAPQAPEDKGSPTTQVWVDLRTALYYCPGADSYGKTPKGKFMTQRDAQLDSYEPAYRKACN